MTLETRSTGIDLDGRKVEQGFERKHQLPNGMIVYTEPARSITSNIIYFQRETGEINLNVDGSFGAVGAVINDGGTTTSADSGTTTATTANKLVDAAKTFTTTVVAGMIVHNTTDNTYARVTAVDSDTTLSLSADIMTTGESYVVNPVWAGTASKGNWNFADAGKITLTDGDDSDIAIFNSDPLAIYQGSDFTALTGLVQLTSYSSANNDITLEFTLDGVVVGNGVSLNDYINTTETVEQTFAIPLDDFNLANEAFNDFEIIYSRSGGQRSDLSFDDIKLEASGGITFTAKPNKDTILYLNKVRFLFINNASKAAMQSYDLFGGETALTNGITFQRTQSGKVNFSVVINQLSDFILTGAIELQLLTGGTDSIQLLEAVFPDPIVLFPEDKLTLTIADDLTGLIQLNASVIGGEEKI